MATRVPRLNANHWEFLRCQRKGTHDDWSKKLASGKYELAWHPEMDKFVLEPKLKRTRK